MEWIGPYRIEGEIARGGMGVVYLAQGPGGRVALKLLLAQRSASPQARRRFAAEVNALARLRHPNVVAIEAAGEHQGAPWLALEYVDGESLEARLARGPLPLWEALRYAQQLAQALSYVHGCGVVHRDLKPDNVLLADGRARLTDFGIAQDSDASRPRLTATGAFLGTPGYWSPEQAQGRAATADARSDVYGFGALLYACLVGRPPVQASSLQGYMHAARFRAIEAPRSLRSEVPEWLGALCMRCLAYDPVARPASMEEVARELALAQQGEAPIRRRVLAWGLVGVGVSALLVARGGGWLASAPQEFSSDVPLSLAPTARAKALIEEGRDALARMDPAAAERAFASAIAADPADAEAYEGRGVARVEQGHLEAALVDFDRAIELDPLRALAHMRRGAVYQTRGDAAAAEREIERALDLDGSIALAWAVRGELRLQRGHELEAERDFAQALALDPTLVAVREDRGAVLHSLDRWDEAEDELDRAIAERPTPRAYLARGHARSCLGRPQEALADYSSAVALDDTFAVGFLWRGVLLQQLGRLEEARYDAERALGLDRTLPKAHALRGALHYLQGEDGLAIECASRALDLDSEVDDANRVRGAALLRQGRHWEAVRDYRRALELDPGDAQATMGLGTAHYNLGEVDAALEHLGRAIELSPQLVQAYANRGAVLAFAERWSEAVVDLDRALELNPNLSGTVYVHRGRARLHLGRYPEATLDFQHALKVGVPPGMVGEVQDLERAARARQAR